jgi:hypothetical protein
VVEGRGPGVLLRGALGKILATFGSTFGFPFAKELVHEGAELALRSCVVGAHTAREAVALVLEEALMFSREIRELREIGRPSGAHVVPSDNVEGVRLRLTPARGHNGNEGVDGLLQAIEALVGVRRRCSAVRDSADRLRRPRGGSSMDEGMAVEILERRIPRKRLAGQRDVLSATVGQEFVEGLGQGGVGAQVKLDGDCPFVELKDALKRLELVEERRDGGSALLGVLEFRESGVETVRVGELGPECCLELVVGLDGEASSGPPREGVAGVEEAVNLAEAGLVRVLEEGVVEDAKVGIGVQARWRIAVVQREAGRERRRGAAGGKCGERGEECGQGSRVGSWGCSLRDILEYLGIVGRGVRGRGGLTPSRNHRECKAERACLKRGS